MNRTRLLLAALLAGSALLSLALLFFSRPDDSLEAAVSLPPAPAEEPSAIEPDSVLDAGAIPVDSATRTTYTGHGSTPVQAAEPEPPPVSVATVATFRVFEAGTELTVAGVKLLAEEGFEKQLIGTSDEAGVLNARAVRSDAASPLGPLIWFEAGGYTRKYVRGDQVRLASSEPQRIDLERDARLDVYVVDGSGAPLPGLIVAVQTTSVSGTVYAPKENPEGALVFSISHDAFDRPSDQRIGGGGPWSHETDDAGYVGMEGLPANEPLLLTIGRGRRVIEDYPEQLTLEAGSLETLTIEVDVPMHFALTGTVVDARTGSALPDLTLLATLQTYDFGPSAELGNRPGPKARSDANGRFEFRDLTEGTWYLGAAPGQALPLEERASLTFHRVVVAPGEDLEGITLRLSVGAVVSGKVVDLEGTPVPHIRLELKRESDGFAYPIHGGSKEDGTFSIGPIDHDLDLRLGFSGPTGQGSSDELPVRTGDANVVMVFVPAPALEVRLIDLDGSRLEISRIIQSREGEVLSTMHQMGGSKSATLEMPTGAQSIDVAMIGPRGRIGVHAGLTAGSHERPPRYEVQAHRPAHLTVSSKAQQGDAATVILSEGVVVGFDRIENGAQRQYFVPPGPVTVRATVDGETFEQTIELESLKSGEVVIQL